MVCFFLSLLKQKFPQGCPKRVGGRGVKATFGQCPKVSSFFSGCLPLVYGDNMVDIIFGCIELKGPSSLGKILHFEMHHLTWS